MFRQRATLQTQGKMAPAHPQGQYLTKPFIQTPPLPSTSPIVSSSQQGTSCNIQQHTYAGMPEKQNNQVRHHPQPSHPFQAHPSGYPMHPTQGQLNSLNFQQQQQQQKQQKQQRQQQQQQMLHIQHQQHQAMLYQQQQRWFQQHQQNQQSQYFSQHFATNLQSSPSNDMQQIRKISMNQVPQNGLPIPSQAQPPFHVPFLQPQQQSHLHPHYQPQNSSRIAHPFAHLSSGQLQTFPSRQNGNGNVRANNLGNCSTQSAITSKDTSSADQQPNRIAGSAEDMIFIDNTQNILTPHPTGTSESSSLIDIFPHSSSVSLSGTCQGGEEAQFQSSSVQEPSCSSTAPGISFQTPNISNGNSINDHHQHQHHHLNFMTSIVDDEAIGKIEESLLGDLDNLFCSSASAANTITESSSTYS